MADVLKKVPVREQAPKVRATNFEEVCLGYNKEEAMEVNWSVSLLTGRRRMVSNQFRLHRRTDIKLQ